MREHLDAQRAQHVLAGVGHQEELQAGQQRAGDEHARRSAAPARPSPAMYSAAVACGPSVAYQQFARRRWPRRRRRRRCQRSALRRRRQIAVDRLAHQVGNADLEIGADDDQHRHARQDRRVAAGSSARSARASRRPRSACALPAEAASRVIADHHRPTPASASSRRWRASRAPSRRRAASCRCRRRSRTTPAAPRACRARRSGPCRAPGSGRRSAPC